MQHDPLPQAANTCGCSVNLDPSLESVGSHSGWQGGTQPRADGQRLQSLAENASTCSSGSSSFDHGAQTAHDESDGLRGRSLRSGASSTASEMHYIRFHDVSVFLIQQTRPCPTSAQLVSSPQQHHWGKLACQGTSEPDRHCLSPSYHALQDTPHGDVLIICNGRRGLRDANMMAVPQEEVVVHHDRNP